MKPSATLAMTARTKKRRRDGFPVIGLSAGEPDFDTPKVIGDAAIAAIQEGFTRYTVNAGMLELREGIAAKLRQDSSLSYTPDEILCSNGAKQSVAQSISVLCDAGDEVLIPAPYWVSYPEMVRFAGANPVFIPTDVASGYRITPAQLEAAITPRTRVLMLCSPSNPTGTVYSRDEFEALADVLRKHPDIYVVSDEIYEYIVYDAEHVSVATLDGLRERTVTINGFSKSYAMTGWRLGYLAAPAPIVQAAAKLQSQSTSAPSSISQKAGIAALQMDRGPLDEMRTAFRRRRDFVLSSLAGIPDVTCARPEGAFYVFPDISGYFGRSTPDGSRIQSSEELCIYILEHFNVGLVPGQAFGGPGGIRLSYAASMSNLEEAMKRIIAALSSLSS